MAGLTVDGDVAPDFGRGLLPVVVQSSEDGAVLMLAWANEEALGATLSTAQAHFWSRSRDELWRKGATSGNVLDVDSVAVDCDGDALLYRVRQRGPACHTGRRSCFENGPDGADGLQPRLSLAELERVIAARAGSPPEESYTARLLAAAPAKPAAKLVEEAGETAVAALSESSDRLAEEAADLLYHLLVVLRSRQVPLAEVERRLAERQAR